VMPIAAYVRLIISECSVSYTGRGKTALEAGVRLIILKKDGSVSVHSDNRAYKPLNWMLTPCEREEYVNDDGFMCWRFHSKKDELEIVFHSVVADIQHEWEEEEPGLVREWTETDLQEWIAQNPEEVFGGGWSFFAREYPTGAGPVDILMKDPKGFAVAVEVKRTAYLPAVDQVLRYCESLEASDDLHDASIMAPVKAVIVALEVKESTRKLAERRGVSCIVVSPPR